jgi:NAD(P)-dependent dehydrogenase (short-subunit alcohol dehydrogenase family)
MGSLAGIVAIVTGGNSGIGRATAERLAADGAAVVIGARRRELGAEVVAGIEAAGGRATFVPTDVTVERDAAALVETAVRTYGRLDAAFNNAGGGSAFGPLAGLDRAAFSADVDLNLTSTFLGMKHQIPALLDAGGGAILNNASNFGVVGMAGAPAYVAAKHAVVGLTRATALELAETGVRVNALLTGGVDTPMFRGTIGATEEGAAHIREGHPVKRVGRPEEVASFAAYLLGPESTFVTGAALAVDGGWTTQ